MKGEGRREEKGKITNAGERGSSEEERQWGEEAGRKEERRSWKAAYWGPPWGRGCEDWTVKMPKEARERSLSRDLNCPWRPPTEELALLGCLLQPGFFPPDQACPAPLLSLLNPSRPWRDTEPAPFLPNTPGPSTQEETGQWSNRKRGERQFLVQARRPGPILPL